MTSQQNNNYYIGIDASTSSTGFAVMNDKFELIEWGKILAKADNPSAFNGLYTQLKDLFLKYQPKGILCEQQYMGGNVSTTVKLIRPTGVVLAAAGLLPNLSFDFIFPTSWRKIYHTGTQFEKQNKKQDTFALTQLRYPNAVTSFSKDNDIADAIGIAYVCVVKGVSEDEKEKESSN